MKYELINLNLGENPRVRDFHVGPYRITLVDGYDALQPQLSEQTRLKHAVTYVDGQEIRQTTETPSRPGKALVTATAECDEEPESAFYDGEPRGIWDACVVFSFLLGRRVFLPGEERHNIINHHGIMVVPYYQIHEAAAIAWPNRYNFKSESEKLPLWYYLSMNDTPVQQIRLLLGCVALEIIQNLDENKVESPQSEKEIDRMKRLERLIDEVRKQIDQSQTDEDTKNRLKGAVGKWGRSGPQQAFNNMLINYGLIDGDIDGIALKRVKGINTMRNDVVHSGKLSPPRWVENRQAQIKAGAFIRARFIPALVLAYLNRKLSLQKFDYVKRNTGILKEYIYNGTHEGDPIEIP
jgi:hypothetical protein